MGPFIAIALTSRIRRPSEIGSLAVNQPGVDLVSVWQLIGRLSEITEERVAGQRLGPDLSCAETVIALR